MQIDVLMLEDESLERIMEEAAKALHAAGLSVRDFIDALPQARQDVYERTFSPAFRREIEQLGEAENDECGQVEDGDA